MKILGKIFEFLINPFAVLANIDIKNTENNKRKWLVVIIWLLLSVALSAIAVYVMHNFMR